MTVFASTGGPSEGVMGFRFFDDEAPAGGGLLVPGCSSVALRFLLFWTGVPVPEAAGLPARLPAELGVTEEVPFCPLANGLVRFAPFMPGLGGLGLVARLATMEWPPRPDAAGEVARDPAPGAIGGRAGVWERDGGCEGCG